MTWDTGGCFIQLTLQSGVILSKVSSNSMGVMMNDEGHVLEKRQLWLNSKHYFIICPEGARKTMKNIN